MHVNRRHFSSRGVRFFGVHLVCNLEACSICESSQMPRAPQAVSPAAPPWAVLPMGYPPLLSGHRLAGVRPCAFLGKKGTQPYLVPTCDSKPFRSPAAHVPRVPRSLATSFRGACPLSVCIGPGVLFGRVSPYRILAPLLLLPFETRRVKPGNSNKPSLNARNV